MQARERIRERIAVATHDGILDVGPVEQSLRVWVPAVEVSVAVAVAVAVDEAQSVGSSYSAPKIRRGPARRSQLLILDVGTGALQP